MTLTERLAEHVWRAQDHLERVRIRPDVDHLAGAEHELDEVLRILADVFADGYTGPDEGAEFASLCNRCRAHDHPAKREHSCGVPGGGVACNCLCNRERPVRW